ncbi:MAG: hypothetical protein KDB09_02110 [Acidimicrobiales bacterium]|nr:hypothetical protein [Acidimicrobiales bacterium]
MALTQRSRSAIYAGLSDVITDPQAVEEMLAYFPARDVEEPVTKEFLRAEMSVLSAELRGEMSDLRTELRGEMSGLRTELRDEMAALRLDMEAKFNRLLFQLLASMAAFVSLVLAISRLS